VRIGGLEVGIIGDTNQKINAINQIPLAPLKKGGTGIKVPLFKGDLGGSLTVAIKD
jgi:hypothetical protein